MGEIRIVGPGKTRGYPYLVCKKVTFICLFYFCDYLSFSHLSVLAVLDL